MDNLIYKIKWDDFWTKEWTHRWHESETASVRFFIDRAVLDDLDIVVTSHTNMSDDWLWLHIYFENGDDKLIFQLYYD